jgi:hypothetical protein
MFNMRELISANRKEIAQLLSNEHGKVLSDALGEVARGLENVEFACGVPNLLKGGYSEQASTGVDVYSIKQPLGVVAGITRTPKAKENLRFSTRSYCKANCFKGKEVRFTLIILAGGVRLAGRAFSPSGDCAGNWLQEKSTSAGIKYCLKFINGGFYILQ